MTATEPERPIDPVIVDYVAAVANRFGAEGLEEMITAATHELGIARAALAELAELGD